MGAPARPKGSEKIRRNSQGKLVSAPPRHTKCTPGSTRVNFCRTFLLGRTFAGLLSSFRPSFKGED